MENKFAERLTEVLEEKGLSKRKCATLCGISAQSISDWTTGKIQPTAEMIFILCKVLNESADYLLGLTDIEEKPNHNIKYYKCKINL